MNHQTVVFEHVDMAEIVGQPRRVFVTDSSRLTTTYNVRGLYLKVGTGEFGFDWEQIPLDETERYIINNNGQFFTLTPEDHYVRWSDWNSFYQKEADGRFTLANRLEQQDGYIYEYFDGKDMNFRVLTSDDCGSDWDIVSTGLAEALDAKQPVGSPKGVTSNNGDGYTAYLFQFGDGSFWLRFRSPQPTHLDYYEAVITSNPQQEAVALGLPEHLPVPAY